MTCRMLIISDICAGKHASLGICVRGNAIPGETHITMTPGIFHGTERNVSAELLRYKIRNGTSQIISCDPSDHINTCIRHFSCIEHSTKYFTALYLYLFYILFYWTCSSCRTEAFAGCLQLATYLSVSYYISKAHEL